MTVSVVMPTYNCADYIAKSIDSVIAQTFGDWELLVMDDHSSDNTADVLAPYLEKYGNIHYHCSPKNVGASAMRNEGIMNSTGRYIAFLDSDDLWMPNKLEKQLEFMQKHDAAFSCTGYEYMDASGKRLMSAYIPQEKVDYKRCIRLSNPIGTLSAMFDTQKVGKIQAPPIKKRNDFAMWLQILKKTDYCYGMPDILGYYRAGRSGSLSSNKVKLAKYHWELYHDVEKLGFFRSVHAMTCWAFVKGTGIGLKKIKLDK